MYTTVAFDSFCEHRVDTRLFPLGKLGQSCVLFSLDTVQYRTRDRQTTRYELPMVTPIPSELTNNWILFVS